jgi:ribosomal protein S18 acetylase RimI-like enzyme
LLLCWIFRNARVRIRSVIACPVHAISSLTESTPEFRPCDPGYADGVAALVYESSPELLDFMFASRPKAEAVLKKLLSLPKGQFGYQFATVMLSDGAVAGVVLGYDRTQLSAQALPGAINMLRATPLSRWLHLIGTVNKALSGYVPPPSTDAYYINNIAVDGARRGLGLGARLLDQAIDTARAAGYRSVELDVTESNDGAIRFYQRFGFNRVAVSGSDALMQKYTLPKLNRMRLEGKDGSVKYR